MKSRALLIRLVLYGILFVIALKIRDRMQQLPRTSESPPAPLQVTIESPAEGPPATPAPVNGSSAP
jgi:hypothetical protein